jgi:hypothetical protein
MAGSYKRIWEGVKGLHTNCGCKAAIWLVGEFWLLAGGLLA